MFPLNILPINVRYLLLVQIV